MATSNMIQPSVFILIAETGIVAKAVLLFLLSASIYCWAIIFTKWKIFSSARRQDDLFMATFWNGKNFEEILAKCDEFPKSPVAAIFKNGLKEFRKFPTDTPQSPSSEKIDNI